MKFSVNAADLINLGSAINAALTVSLNNLSHKEPQLVANMVFHLPRAINSLSFSGGFSVKSGGVFVHGQPFVKCDSFPLVKPASVELGDLLLLRTGKHNGSVLDRRAMLIQAKKFKKLPVLSVDQNQHHLYAQWPEFEYVRSGNLSGEKRHIQGIDLYNGSKYLLIGPKDVCAFCSPCCSSKKCIAAFHSFPISCHCVLTAQPSEPELSHYRCVLNEVFDFILGDAGKTYTTPPPSKSRNWDRVIDDLTTSTAKRTSVFMGTASSGMSRSRGVSLCCMVGVFDSTSILCKAGIPEGVYGGGLNGPPEVPLEPEFDEEGHGGISTIEFVVESEGEIRG